MVLVSVLGLAALGLWIYMMPTLSRVPISHIRVVGELREINEVSLQKAISVHSVKGFFGLDLVAVREDILKLPWLKSVSVRRIWPRGLRVIAVEHKAEARWHDGGFLAADGTLFYPSASRYSANLPILKGTVGIHTEMLWQFRELRQALRPIKRQIWKFIRTKRPVWRVELDDGLVIVFEKRNSIAAIKKFAKTAAALFGKRLGNLSRVDLRYANGFSVRWRQNVSSLVSYRVNSSEK